jgi:hypothetical protein
MKKYNIKSKAKKKVSKFKKFIKACKDIFSTLFGKKSSNMDW